jgi:hypothetical protein
MTTQLPAIWRSQPSGTERRAASKDSERLGPIIES